MNVLEQAQEKLDKAIRIKADVLSKLQLELDKAVKNFEVISLMHDSDIENNQKIVDEIKLKFFS